MKHKTTVTIDSCAKESLALSMEFQDICRYMSKKYSRNVKDLVFITQDFNTEGQRIEGDGNVQILVIDHSQVAILSKVRNRLNWTITTLIDLTEEFDAKMVVIEQKRREYDERMEQDLIDMGYGKY